MTQPTLRAGRWYYLGLYSWDIDQGDVYAVADVLDSLRVRKEPLWTQIIALERLVLWDSSGRTCGFIHESLLGGVD